MNPTFCGECGGTLESRVITYIHQSGEEVYRFEDVPAFVCVQCGHIWLSAEVSQQIDEIVQAHSRPEKVEKLPVFSLARRKAAGA